MLNISVQFSLDTWIQLALVHHPVDVHIEHQVFIQINLRVLMCFSLLTTAFVFHHDR